MAWLKEYTMLIAQKVSKPSKESTIDIPAQRAEEFFEQYFTKHPISQIDKALMKAKNQGITI